MRLRYDGVSRAVFDRIVAAAREHFGDVVVLQRGEPSRLELTVALQSADVGPVGVPHPIEGGGTETIELALLLRDDVSAIG